MRFESPNTLWLLLIVPVVIWLYVVAWRKKYDLMTKFIHPNLFAPLTESVWFKMRKWKIVLTICAIVFLLIASARPQWGFKWEEIKQRGLDIIVVIDTSRSMLAEDIKPNRLERAKLSAIDLMTISKSDRFGLVAFSGVSFLQCPLTLDEEAFRQSVHALDTEIMPQGGTAIADAIRTAADGFKEGTDNYKIIVLFSDGEDHEEGALEAAEEASKKGIKIFTVGVGTPEGDTLKIRAQSGKYEPVVDENGKPVISKLNPSLLQQIAAKGGGFYLQLTGAKTMDTLYQMGLAPLPKGEQSARLVKKYNERFYIPLLIAILLLIVEILLPERKNAFKPFKLFGKLGIYLMVLLLMSNTLEASVRSAVKNYNEGKYKTALQDYKELLKKKPDDPRLAYNAGNAAYQIGRYEEAANYFNQAMNAPKNPQLQQKACYNYGNALYRLGMESSNLDEKENLWKQAIVQYETALKFNPNDADAKSNIDFVKKKLEELQKQKQQNQQQNQNDQNQDDKNKQDKGKQEQQQKQQQKNQDKGQDKNGDQQQQSQQARQEKKQQSNQQGQSKQQAQQNNTGETNGASLTEGDGKVFYMTPQQAMQLLEAQKSEEKMLLFTPETQSRRSQNDSRTMKNW